MSRIRKTDRFAKEAGPWVCPGKTCTRCTLTEEQCAERMKEARTRKPVSNQPIYVEID